LVLGLGKAKKERWKKAIRKTPRHGNIAGGEKKIEKGRGRKIPLMQAL